MNGESSREFKQKSQREVVRRWFQAHPNYQREYLAKQKQLRAELGTALNGTLPVKTLKKINYTINVNRPLKSHERRKTRQRRNVYEQSLRSSDQETFEPTDTW